MKIIFLGTSDFSCVCLQSLINSHHKVVAVVCQPDKATGRGNKMLMPPVKIMAQQNNIPVYQFAKIRVDGVETLKSIDADIMVTASYGQILSQEIIDICRYGIVNVHGSLLPKYRGASPIQYAIMNGEKETGITIMKTEAGIDNGDMLLKSCVKIEENDTYGTLSQKLANVGSGLIVEALDLIEKGKAVWVKQKEDDATFTKMIKSVNETLDFNKTGKELVNYVRALNPNPISNFLLNKIVVKVFEMKSCENNENVKNGTIIEASCKKGLIIKCNGGSVEVLTLQFPGKKAMTAKSYLNGNVIEKGIVVNE